MSFVCVWCFDCHLPASQGPICLPSMHHWRSCTLATKSNSILLRRGA